MNAFRGGSNEPSPSLTRRCDGSTISLTPKAFKNRRVTDYTKKSMLVSCAARHNQPAYLGLAYFALIVSAICTNVSSDGESVVSNTVSLTIIPSRSNAKPVTLPSGVSI